MEFSEEIDLWTSVFLGPKSFVQLFVEYLGVMNIFAEFSIASGMICKQNKKINWLNSQWILFAMNNSTTTNYLAPVEERERNRYANMMLPLFCLSDIDVEKGKCLSRCTLTGRCVISKERGLNLPKLSIYVSIYTFIQKHSHIISVYLISLLHVYFLALLVNSELHMLTEACWLAGQTDRHTNTDIYINHLSFFTCDYVDAEYKSLFAWIATLQVPNMCFHVELWCFALFWLLGFIGQLEENMKGKDLNDHLTS